MKYLLALTILIAVILGGCQPIVFEPEGTLAQAEDDAATEAEVDAVRAASAAWDEAFNAGDLEALMELYAEDAVDMPPGFPAIEGIEAIAGDLEYILGEYDAHHETSIVDIKIGGDLAVERANYTMELTPKAGGETMTEVGKHIVVRQKIDDEWKVLWEIWNGDGEG